MASFISIIKNIFLSFLLVFAIAVAPLTIGLNSFHSTLLNESFWLNSFDEIKLYDSITTAANLALAPQEESPGISFEIPSFWFKEQAERVVPDLMQFLRSEKQAASAVISLKELKLQYADAVLLKAKKDLIIEIPECSALDSFSFSQVTNLPNCWPSTEEQKLNAMDLVLESNGNEKIPDTITLQEFFDSLPEEKNRGFLVNLRNAVQFISFSWIALALLFAFSLLLILIISRSFKLLGFALLVSGLSSALSAIISFLLLSIIVPEKIFSGELSFMNSAIKPLIEKIAFQMQSNALIYSGILVFFGIAFIVLGFLIQKPDVKVKDGSKANPENVRNQ